MEEKVTISSPHLLCFSGDMFLFKCRRTTESNDGKVGDLTLVFSRLTYNGENSVFVEAAEGAVALGGGISTRADILTCKCVINCQKRLNTPCVLVLKKRGSEEHFQYRLFALSSDRLELCLEFRLPYEMREDVRVLGGPAVMWRHAGDVCFITPRTRSVRRLPLQVRHCVFGELPLCKGDVFVIGVQELSNTNPGHFIENGHTFDGDMILPHPYVRLTQCMLVLSAEKTECNKVIQSAVVAATSRQQLVYFENGMVKNACQLPFEQANNIQIVDAGRSGGMYVISFQQGSACAVWKATFQIAAQWSNVDSVHVGDLLGCGTEQMLLVFKARSVTGQPLDTFLLTDLCGIASASYQFDEAPKTASLPENNVLTLQALESRLQVKPGFNVTKCCLYYKKKSSESGTSVLQELQREVREKERVLRHSVKALTDVLSNREASLTRPEQEGLFALWDHDDESKENALDGETAVVPAVSSEPHVDRLWHRVIEDRLVVGVMLTADSSAPVASVSLSVVTEADQSAAPAVIQTQSQALWLPAPCSSSSSSSSSASMFLEPAAKRSKQHSDLSTCRLAVTAVTRLTPLLNSACVKCSVMLSYVQKHDAFAPASSSIPHVLHCGKVVLDVHGDFQSRLLKTPQLETDEAKEDLLSLMTVLDHWVFLIDSPDYSLGDVEGWIQKRLGCKRMELTRGDLYFDSSEPPTSVLLRWCPITTFQGELSVHASQLKMLQFLDSFLAFLPVSCSIRPVHGAQGQTAAQTFALVLEKEVASLGDSLASLLCDDGKEDQASPEHEAPEPGSAMELQGWRDLWQLDVEKSRKRLHPLVDVGRYRSLMQRVYDAQQNVDLVALLDTRRTFLG